MLELINYSRFSELRRLTIFEVCIPSSIGFVIKYGKSWNMIHESGCGWETEGEIWNHDIVGTVNVIESEFESQTI